MGKIKINVKVIDGVHCIQGRFSRFGERFHFCIYFVDGVLIDTGPSRARKEITEVVRALNPGKIALTHSHEDHSGNAAWLAKNLGIPVIMSKRTAEVLKQPNIPLYRRMVWGNLEPVSGEILEKSISTPRHTLEVAETPGHSDDHVCFVEQENGWLFSGDLFLDRRLHFGMPEESVPKLIASISKVLAYRFDTLFCGHSGCNEHGRKALQEKKRFLRNLTEKTFSLSEKGYTGKQIARKLLPRQWGIEIFSGGELSPVHLISSIVNDQKEGELDSY